MTCETWCMDIQKRMTRITLLLLSNMSSERSGQYREYSTDSNTECGNTPFPNFVRWYGRTKQRFIFKELCVGDASLQRYGPSNWVWLYPPYRRSQWPRGLRCRSVAARLLRSWVRILPGAWMFVCCECCVLSGRGLCDELITRPEESYRLWCVVCDLENLKNEETITRVGSQRHLEKKSLLLPY